MIAEAGGQLAPPHLSRLAHGHPTSLSKGGQRNQHWHLEL